MQTCWYSLNPEVALPASSGEWRRYWGLYRPAVQTSPCGGQHLVDVPEERIHRRRVEPPIVGYLIG